MILAEWLQLDLLHDPGGLSISGGHSCRAVVAWGATDCLARVEQLWLIDQLLPHADVGGGRTGEIRVHAQHGQSAGRVFRE